MLTQLTAAIDRGLIKGSYFHTGSIAPVDITVKVYHKYTSPNNTSHEVQIEEFSVPSAAVKLTGSANSTEPLRQQVDFHVNNLRYTDNLVIQVDEYRNNLLVSTRVDVMTGDEYNVPVERVNPMEHSGHEENTPPEEPYRPSDNIVIPDVLVGGSVYSYQHSGLKMIQASQRVYLDKSEQPQVFRSQSFNRVGRRTFIENSVKNYLSNVEFTSLTTTLPVVPLNYLVDAPGFIVTSQVVDGPLSGLKIWKLRASSTNAFSAFDTVIIKYKEKAEIDLGLNSLTASVYYQIASDFGRTPFSKLRFKLSFYDQDQLFISDYQNLVSIGAEGGDWKVLHTTADSVPLTAQYVDYEVEIVDVDSTDPFVFQMCLPQLEASVYPTSRALYERIQDQYSTATPVAIKNPFYVFLKTTHIEGPAQRGLVDNTTVLKDGIQWYVSSEKYFLKVYDPNGAAVYSVTSSPLTSVEGDVVEYGMAYDGSNINFYENQILVSSHPVLAPISYDKHMLVGSLLPSNTAINTELLDFGIAKDSP